MQNCSNVAINPTTFASNLQQDELQQKKIMPKKSVLNSKNGDTSITEYGDLSYFMKPLAYSTFTEAIRDSCPECNVKAVKVFPGLATTFTSDISRLGDVVDIPDFWATLILQFNNSNSLEPIYNSLKTIPNVVVYSSANFYATFASMPNDSLYPNQASLHPTSTYLTGDINIEEAWSIIPRGGEPFIKVGIFDTGIKWEHRDFGYNGFTPSTSKITGGWDFETQSPLKNHPLGRDYDNHGTRVTGIIGARRNNLHGISGIAGGNDSI